MARKCVHHRSGTRLPITVLVDTLAGDFVKRGRLWGVAELDALAGEETELSRAVGEYTIPKAAGVSFAVGDPVTWDEADNEANDDTGSNDTVATCVVVAATDSPSVRVALLP